jgi:hypothetical protein
MKETRYNLRLTRREKESLNASAKQNGVSIISYIKQKIFSNNADTNEEGVTYELPSKEKHEYFNTWVLHTVYMLLLNNLCEGKTADEALEIKERCKDRAKKNIANQGYVEIKKKSG